MESKEEIVEYFNKELQKAELEKASMKHDAAATYLQQQRMSEEHEPGMIKEQLSLGEELRVIDYLLRSWTLEFSDETQQQRWVKPSSEDMIILSDYGVHYFRQVISWYINKNTLLSAYEEKEIKQKMYDLAMTINDDIYLEYELIFKMPSRKRCEEELNKRINEMVERKAFSYRMINEPFDIGNIRLQVMVSMNLVEDVDGRIIINNEVFEKEILKIRDLLFNNKLKRFPSILRFVQDTIHSSYNRAMGGQERRSLRQHMQITETKGGYTTPMPEAKGGIMGMFKKK